MIYKLLNKLGRDKLKIIHKQKMKEKTIPKERKVTVKKFSMHEHTSQTYFTLSELQAKTKNKSNRSDK
jgi:hypothetical protein